MTTTNTARTSKADKTATLPDAAPAVQTATPAAAAAPAPKRARRPRVAAAVTRRRPAAPRRPRRPRSAPAAGTNGYEAIVRFATARGELPQLVAAIFAVIPAGR